MLLFIVNATPVVRHGYRMGVPESGYYEEILNTDAQTYGGSNVGNCGGQEAEAQSWQGRDHSLIVSLPPLAVVGFRLVRASKESERPDNVTGLLPAH